jgi:hypothetical protein
VSWLDEAVVKPAVTISAFDLGKRQISGARHRASILILVLLIWLVARIVALRSRPAGAVGRPLPC